MSKQVRIQSRIDRLENQFNYQLALLREYFKAKNLQYMKSWETIDEDNPDYAKLRHSTVLISSKIRHLKQQL